MRHAKVNLVRTVAAAQVRLDPHLQAVDPRRGLSQNARRLVDHQAAALFVEDLKAKRVRHGVKTWTEPKAEIRISKSETSSKQKAKMFQTRFEHFFFEFWICFGFRYSDFGFQA